MKDTDFSILLELEHQQGLFKPVNQAAIDFVSNLKHKERVYLKDVTQRDIKFHKTYFALLKFVYGLMPKEFKFDTSPELFYLLLKEVFGEYKIYKVSGIEVKKHTSISFGNMSQNRFKAYVKNQIPLIYEFVFMIYKDDLERGEMVRENIENEFEKFLSQL